ncbi:MAG: hypothetical protein NTX22_04200 [Ignavibacteriales bacterium]|nr:hypothetical protein [Ignavibacteriales bacterium]
MRERNHYSVIILRELLENSIPISQLAEKYGVHVNDIYKLLAAGKLEKETL